MLSSIELMRKFESAAHNLVHQKLPRQMVTLTEGEQPLEQYEMVLFISNSFLLRLGYLMPAISASLIMFCLFHCVLAPLISGIYKACQQAQKYDGEIGLHTIFCKILGLFLNVLGH